MDRPTGKLTFLFSDVEGSTRLLMALGDGYAQAHREHQQIVRDGIGAHAGMDGPFTIFGFPAAAERDVVALDSAADALYLENPEDVGRYRRVFRRLLPAALTPRASAELIAGLQDPASS